MKAILMKRNVQMHMMLKSVISAAVVAAGVCAFAGERVIDAQEGDDLQTKVAEARAAIEGGASAVKIQVGPGTYPLTAQLVLDKPISLVSTHGPDATIVLQTTVAWNATTEPRVVCIKNAEARVEGFTLTIPNFTISENGFPSIAGGTVRMEANGVVSNCVLRGSGGLVGTQNQFTIGGGVWMNAGTVVDCVISDYQFSSGSGAWVEGTGKLLRCDISKCRAGNRTDKYTGGMGAGIRMSGTALVEDCTVRDCTSSYFPGVGVYVLAGTLKNSRILNNRMTTTTDGYCNEGLGVYQAGGTVTGCVMAGNLAGNGECEDYFASGGTITGSQSGLYMPGEGNVGREPLFADFAGGDYRLLKSFTASAVDILPGTEVTFTAEDLSGSGYTWDFGDGEPATGSQISHAFAAKGAYDVTLTYNDGNGQVVRKRPAFIRVYGGEAFVSADAGDGVFPYDTAETATSNAWAAAEAVRIAAKLGATNPVLHVGEGEFPLFHAIVADVAYRIEGAGRETSLLYAYNNMSRALNLSAAGAVVSGVSLKGKWEAARADNYGYGPGARNGLGVMMSEGTITNCTVKGASGGGQAWLGSGGGVWMSGGQVVDSVISDNATSQLGKGIYATGGSIERCVISGNRGGSQWGGGRGAGVFLNGPVRLANSLVVNNSCTYHEGGGVVMTHQDASVVNCTIVGNDSTELGGGGVYMTAGALRNSIVWGNTKAQTETSDIVTTGGAVTYTLTSAEITGEGNLVGTPTFADRARGDYRLVKGSAGVDAGENVQPFDFDLDFHERPWNGNGTEVYRTDMGCYELVPPGAPKSLFHDAAGRQQGGKVSRVGGDYLHTFTNSGSFMLSVPMELEVFLVGGGGAGGWNGPTGGGGGGGVLRTTLRLLPGTYDVVVGAGGVAAATAVASRDGGNSSFGGAVALGGGGGGNANEPGRPGGSGGGAAGNLKNTYAGGVGTEGQGYSGGNSKSTIDATHLESKINWNTYYGGAGGGGAGEKGHDVELVDQGEWQSILPGDGGDGVMSDFSGAEKWYGGGGGGGGNTLGGPVVSSGGKGGGGSGSGYNGSNNYACPAGSGEDGTGGGGGGGGQLGNGNPDETNHGGNGGSGIVMIRYHKQNSGLILIVK